MQEVALPRIDPAAVDRLTAYLRGKSWSQRPAQASARVLACMVRLWEDRREFPTRAQIADHVGVSIPTVDLVLRRHRTGEIAIVYENGAPTVRGRRWVVPSEALRAIGKSSATRVAKFEQAPYRRREAAAQGLADSSMTLT